MLYRLGPRITRFLRRYRAPVCSVDEQPWRHPYLDHENLRRFRRYSEAVWDFALAYKPREDRPLLCAFTVNMAQTMYKWARLAQKYGVDATLFPHPRDGSAISAPEWEDYDGEFSDVLDGEAFRRQFTPGALDVPCRRVRMDGGALWKSWQSFNVGDRRPLLRLLAQAPTVRHETLFSYRGLYPYYEWASALADYDVIYAAGNALPAYFSGRPYCSFSPGGDLIYDCGRADDFGAAMAVAVNGARFLTVTNPHPLAHCRRLGLTNALYLPYAMDDERYSPGRGHTRAEWEAQYGRGVFVLSSARIDAKVKGQDDRLLGALVEAARACPDLRFVFLAWGESANEFRDQIATTGLGNRFVVLAPVGKKRLIDYYRSADIVLDQMVFGYYGATALEAAAVGKPIIMKLRTEHYAPLSGGDVAPIMNVGRPEDVTEALIRLARSSSLRQEQGVELRHWLVRTHGERRCVPLMLALLRLTADRVPLPPDLPSPLVDPESEAERAYHAACLRPVR